MASLSGASVSVSSSSLARGYLVLQKSSPRISSVKSAVSFKSSSISTLHLMRPIQHQRFRISCAAKAETVEKVCAIVKKQLALPNETTVTGESKFASLGADSLDTVEIVMGLEEEFGISVEEESAQSIATIQDAANLIDDLIEKKST